MATPIALKGACSGYMGRVGSGSSSDLITALCPQRSLPRCPSRGRTTPGPMPSPWAVPRLGRGQALVRRGPVASASDFGQPPLCPTGVLMPPPPNSRPFPCPGVPDVRVASSHLTAPQSSEASTPPPRISIICLLPHQALK